MKTNLVRFIIILLIMFSSIPVQSGGIALDGSMGTAGQLKGPDYKIKAEYGQQAGANLFHSFKTFNLTSSESATFSGSSSIQNIISRIIGGSASQIDGKISSTIPNANLYFFNPAGIMFGPNASLDIGGSFHVSTADYLLMGDKTGADRFNAMPKKGEILSSASPTAFGFLPAPSTGDVQQRGIAAITFDGTEIQKKDWNGNPTGLSVPTGKTISVIGGDINIKGTFYHEQIDITNSKDTPTGSLNAPEGRINIVSVASRAETPLDFPLETGTAPLTLPAGYTGGKITLDHALINVSGEGSGNIYIRGGQLVANNSSIQADSQGENDGGITDIQVNTLSLSRSNIFSDAQGTGKGGNINLQVAESVTISDFSKIFADAAGDTADSGDAGSVLIETKKLFISNGGAISSDTYGGGKGGTVTLRAAESISISDPESKVFAGASGTDALAGDAGTILIETPKLSLTNKGNISSDTYYGGAKGGSIIISGLNGSLADSVDVSDSQILSGAMKSKYADAGDGGTVDIKAKNISFTAGGKIGSESNGGGQGGDISLYASESIRFEGMNAEGQPSKAYTSALCLEDYAGNAGNISIKADTIFFKNSGGITASTSGPGNAGTIKVEANRLELSNNASISSASESTGNGGEAGRINIAASDSISLTNSSTVTTSTKGEGIAGDIELTTGSLFLDGSSSVASESLSESLNAGVAGTITLSANNNVTLFGNSAITTEARGAGGGKIYIIAGDVIYLLGSQITSSVKQGEGNGGDVTIKSRYAVLNYSSVTANAEEGDGGAIFIRTEYYLKADHSLVTATSKRGNNGTVKIEAPNIDIMSGLAVLPTNFLDATRWIKIPCAARSGEKVSRFVIKGRDAVPTALNDLQCGERFWFDDEESKGNLSRKE